MRYAKNFEPKVHAVHFIRPAIKKENQSKCQLGLSLYKQPASWSVESIETPRYQREINQKFTFKKHVSFKNYLKKHVREI